MKKVLFVATVTEMHINLFHTPYLKHFKEKGYETHVASKNDYENKNDLNIPYCDKYYDINFKRSPFHKSNISAFKELRKIINENNFDIIHCHTPVGGVVTRLASLFKSTNSKKPKVLYTAHGFHFFRGAPLVNWILFYPVEKFLSRYTDILITINKEDYSRAKTKFHAKDIKYIPGIGIKPEKSLITKNQFEILEIKQQLNIKNDNFIILSVGELNKNKNHEVIIKAIAKLIAHNNIYRNIKYFIVGKGELKDYLLALIKDLNLESNIKLLGYRRDIPELCSISDAFAFPSKREGLGLAALEAMRNKLPIITSNVHGIPDYSVNGLTGYNSDPTNIDAFSNAIKSMYHNRGEIKEMGINNKKLAEKFMLSNVELEMSKIYEKVQS